MKRIDRMLLLALVLGVWVLALTQLFPIMSILIFAVISLFVIGLLVWGVAALIKSR